MIEELDGLCVEREIVRVLIVEEMDCVRIQLQAERLQEEHIVTHDILVGEIEFVDNYRVDVIIAEQVVCKKKEDEGHGACYQQLEIVCTHRGSSRSGCSRTRCSRSAATGRRRNWSPRSSAA